MSASNPWILHVLWGTVSLLGGIVGILILRNLNRIEADIEALKSLKADKEFIAAQFSNVTNALDTIAQNQQNHQGQFNQFLQSLPTLLAGNNHRGR